MKHIHNLEELFIEQLKEQYDGERQQVAALPKLRAGASTTNLKHIIDFQLGKAKKQMNHLTQVFALLGRNLHGEHNQGVEGLIAEALELLTRCTSDGVRDAGIILSVQHLNHHNIASYGTLRTYAWELNITVVGQVLADCLKEERVMDKKLTELAEGGVNLNAID